MVYRLLIAPQMLPALMVMRAPSKKCESPVEVLIEALVKNKDLNRADSISQSYLRLVEKPELDT